METDPEMTRLLARAFDRAWDRYYRPGRVTIAPDVARPALANHLVEMAKEGTLPSDPDFAEWLLLLDHGDLLVRFHS